MNSFFANGKLLITGEYLVLNGALSLAVPTKKGQTLLIIEAMKTMNDILAEKDGTVKDILVQNEQPVQFDDPLMIIK